MSGTKHTPGPWSVEETRGSSVRIVVNGPDVEVCKHNPGRGVVQDEARANARLIAAAPDLLEALLGVIAVADRKTVEFDRARAAISKATSLTHHVGAGE